MFIIFLKRFLRISLAVLIVIILGYFIILNRYEGDGQVQNRETLDVKWEINYSLSLSRGRVQIMKHNRTAGNGDLQNPVPHRNVSISSMEIELAKMQANNKDIIGKSEQGTKQNNCDGVSNCFCPPATFYKRKAEVIRSDSQCKLKQKTFYLRTFKTGSTTMLSILDRHLLSLNKTILMFRSWHTGTEATEALIFQQKSQMSKDMYSSHVTIMMAAFALQLCWQYSGITSESGL